MLRVENQGSTVATYGYDSSNRRLHKTIGTTTIHYLYDLNSRLIAETLVDGTPLREYIYLDGEPVALREYQTNPGTYYFINDHLGTPQQLITATGTVVWQAAYLPFGKAQIQTETVKNNLRFPGQYFDVETGLHYNWNRFYDSEKGRFVTADPIGLKGGMNLYAYVSNNPVNFTDLTGEVIAIPIAFCIANPGACGAVAAAVADAICKAIKGFPPPPDPNTWKEVCEQPEGPFNCGKPPNPCVFICMRAVEGGWFEKGWALPLCLICLMFGGLH
jgi:RHS repeat-associated protein